MKQLSLSSLGWQPFFQQQLTQKESETVDPVRLMAMHRGWADIAGKNGEETVPIHPTLRTQGGAMATVGDWLLLNRETREPQRILERKSLFRRMAAGIELKEQSIAANVDTLFIVSSCNHDFNLNRIERYLALALDAEVTPVVVLTKEDLIQDAPDYCQQARSLREGLTVLSVNATQSTTAQMLLPWCKEGQTIAMLGSSGVGKSTLLNTMHGTAIQLTGGIRSGDSKGRHTTTARSLHLLNCGALLMDTPGMRELQLLDCASGVMETFPEIAEQAQQCRFADCTHTNEPGCAVIKGIQEGTLDQRRVANYQKLLTEQALNKESLADRRSKERKFSKQVKTAVSGARKRKKR